MKLLDHWYQCLQKYKKHCDRKLINVSKTKVLLWQLPCTDSSKIVCKSHSNQALTIGHFILRRNARKPGDQIHQSTGSLFALLKFVQGTASTIPPLLQSLLHTLNAILQMNPFLSTVDHFLAKTLKPLRLRLPLLVQILLNKKRRTSPGWCIGKVPSASQDLESMLEKVHSLSLLCKLLVFLEVSLGSWSFVGITRVGKVDGNFLPFVTRRGRGCLATFAFRVGSLYCKVHRATFP